MINLYNTKKIRQKYAFVREYGETSWGVLDVYKLTSNPSDAKDMRYDRKNPATLRG
jgi:hypothetical protein